MIGRFYNKLFDAADKAKAEGKEIQLQIIRQLEDLLQEAYDSGTFFRSYVPDKEPKNKLEEVVLSIPEIEVYHDSNDDSYYYELDDRHFDYPEEVLKYLIASHVHKDRYYRKKFIRKEIHEVE